MSAIQAYFSTHMQAFWQMVGQHLLLSAVSLGIAAVIALPLGTLCSRFEKLEKISVGFWGALRIVPSLALLFLLVPIVGTGTLPAVIALTVLAIPPILINTALAFRTLPPDIIEAATGMGMPARQLFWQIKVPLAFPTIFSGIRTAAIEVVASATLAAYIGAGGLGNLIVTGLGLMREDLLWIGGISVAVLSLLISAILSAIDRYVRRYERV